MRKKRASKHQKHEIEPVRPVFSFRRGLKGDFQPRMNLAGLRNVAVKAAETGLWKQKISARERRNLEFSIYFCNDSEIKELNGKYRGKDYPTNVLSFPAFESNQQHPDVIFMGESDSVYLGDIAISLPTVLKEADEQGKPFADHLSHLVVHGVLHLLGYDHEDDAEAEEMEALETKILADFKIPNPYS